jgi:hypothetical protein
MNVTEIGTEFGFTKIAVKAKKSSWKGGLRSRVETSIKEFSGKTVAAVPVQKCKRKRPKLKRKRQDYKGMIRQFYTVPSDRAHAAIRALQALE